MSTSDPKDGQSITPMQLMLSSCTGALMTSIIVTPLDVVKIRIQAQQKKLFEHKCFLYCNGLMDHICYCNGNGSQASTSSLLSSQKWFRRPSQFNSTIVSISLRLFDKQLSVAKSKQDAFSKIIRNEGLSSLWSGLPPTLVMALPATMVYFTLYDQLRIKMNAYFKYDTQPLWVPVVAGGTSRMIAATVISPLEMIRTKMQSKKLSYRQMGDAIKSTVRRDGVLSLWRGLGPTILRDVPFSSIYWFNYEFYKSTFNQPHPQFTFSLLAGAASGTVAAIITLPFDVVKTHRQIEIGEGEILATASDKKSRRTHSIMRKIYAEGGLRGLFAGIVPRIIKVAPACAIMISTYEFGKSFFIQYNQSEKSFTQFIHDYHPKS